MNALRTFVVSTGLLFVLLSLQDTLRAEEAADQFDCAACHPL